MYHLLNIGIITNITMTLYLYNLSACSAEVIKNASEELCLYLL